MASNQPPNGSSHTDPAPKDPVSELAQAFKDITKGEQTATAMENKLTNLEQKIDALLVSVGQVENSRQNSSSDNKKENS